MLPDADGNTILHLLALGVIRDAEYDFVKQVIQKYNMRLTRNLENRTPLGIIRSYSQKGGPIRGQPNFKRKLLEFLEIFIAQDPSFQDADQNQDIHDAVIKGNSETVRRMLGSF
jgi:hypothetical protein